MRNLYSLLLGLLFFALLALPLLAGGGKKILSKDPAASWQDIGDTFVLKTKDGNVTLSKEDYICGVVAAEMPALYETEALKAQAVAAYTYAVRCSAASDEEWDLTDDSKIHQAYIDEAARKEKWGENAEAYEKKIREAVNAVLGQCIIYEGEPIFAAYHAISSGRTETALNVWGNDLPYLCGVESVLDKQHENYKSEVVVPLDDFCKKLSLEKPADTSAVTSKIERSTAGTVLSFSVFGKTFSGGDIREAFGLRSANFTFEYKDGSIKFTVLGYGHGVGMSQFGANCLAKEGKTYKEILLWYYPGTTIEQKPSP